MRAMTENIELMMPIKATPYDHQKKAFAFACDKFGVFDNRLKSRGAALLMEMGTGKTIVSIAVAGCMKKCRSASVNHRCMDITAPQQRKITNYYILQEDKDHVR